MTRVARLHVSLARLHTRDGVPLDGVIREPTRRRRAALIWVHGLGSTFASGQPLIEVLSRRLNRVGVAYLKFNNRGHDIVVRGGRRLQGSAFERFTECVEDIRTTIAFARRAGYRTIILAGHSTGANKVLHYAARTRDRRVRGLILLGPVSDIAGEMKEIGPAELRRRVTIAERLAARDPDGLVPTAFGFRSARRYLSLYRAGEAEDLFPYYRSNGRWTALRRIRIPIAVVVGSRDEYLDRPVAALIEAFEKNATKTRSFTAVVIPGALHGFSGHESTLSRELARWIETRCLST